MADHPHESSTAEKTKRGLSILPIAVAAIAVAIAVVFARSHLMAKGPAPQRDITPQQAASGAGPEERGPYNLEDYAEPDRK